MIGVAPNQMLTVLSLIRLSVYMVSRLIKEGVARIGCPFNIKVCQSGLAARQVISKRANKISDRPTENP